MTTGRPTGLRGRLSTIAALGQIALVFLGGGSGKDPRKQVIETAACMTGIISPCVIPSSWRLGVSLQPIFALQLKANAIVTFLPNLGVIAGKLRFCLPSLTRCSCSRFCSRLSGMPNSNMYLRRRQRRDCQPVFRPHLQTRRLHFGLCCATCSTMFKASSAPSCHYNPRNCQQGDEQWLPVQRTCPH